MHVRLRHRKAGAKRWIVILLGIIVTLGAGPAGPKPRKPAAAQARQAEIRQNVPERLNAGD
ncbi:MAG: hypothetical protein U0835_06410 [Isosphaeraceae bacterium]